MCIIVVLFITPFIYITKTKMGKNTSEKAQETAQKKPKGLEKLKKIKKSITELFTGPNNEEAWNKFPEETKKEMLESLNMKDKIQRSTDDILKLSETGILSGIGERLVFKKGIVKKDKIGNYIEIDKLKCRKWQPGITGFVYNEIADRYHPEKRLAIGFCDKGEFIKKTDIDDPQVTKTSTEINEDYPDYATSSSIREIQRREREA